MFKQVKNIVYQVTDIKKAGEWYGAVLGVRPAMSAPFAVSFDLGGTSLVLVPKKGGGEPSGNIVAYWQVDDIDLACEKLTGAGAAIITEVTNVFGSYRASVSDPFGNVIGITGPANAEKRSVENSPSGTAMGVAYLRALAALDEREEIRGKDNLARIFLTDAKGIDDPATRRFLLDKYMNHGIYEFLIARTAFFDDEVRRALAENIPQIVFMGAGYDSRPYRFANLIGDTKIFELDSRHTQRRKKEVLEKNNVAVPPAVTYIEIDFNREKLEDALFAAGYDRSKKTLFVWEGVIYYLEPESIDATLGFVKSNSAAGSLLCFDYCLPTGEVIDEYGVRETIKFKRATHASEPIRFALGRGKIDGFLSERGFGVREHMTAEEMERKYLTSKNGDLAGRITAIYCLACAEVRK